MPVFSKTQKLTQMGMLIAITLILVLTPLGYIPINPIITITIIVTPVIVGGLLNGVWGGVILGLIFGISSFFRAPGEALGQLMLMQSGILTFVTCVFPRLCVGIYAGLMSKLLVKKPNLNKMWFYGIVGLIGSLINTIGFLFFAFFIFGSDTTGITLPVIMGVIATNGIAEMIVNGLLVAILMEVIIKLYKNSKKIRR